MKSLFLLMISQSLVLLEIWLLCLNKVEKWADENGFKFSKTKTVCMHFCNKRKIHPDPTLTIIHKSLLFQIPVVSQTKVLYLTVN